jgi:cytoskeletal protein CcmA (bactofilin family)
LVNIVTSRTIVKKVTVGVPIRGVVSGSFDITNIIGVTLDSVGQGDILVYDAATSSFLADSDTYLKSTDSAEIKSLFSAGGDLSYDSAAGQFSINVDSFASAISAVSYGDGSASAPSITNTGDTNTGLHFPAADTLAFTAGGTSQFTMTDGVIAPVTDNDVDLGTSSLEFKDLYLDGTANIDALVADTADINGGTIDATVIGGSTAAAITGTTITGTSFVIGSASINEAELETIDTITAGTVAASKAVVVDADKDITGFRNITLSGELDAATLDVSGAVDIAGTTNLDVVDIDGAVDMATTLNVTGVLSATSLDISGNVDVDGVLETDGLSINGTTVTSTATELNLLDGVSGLVQADFTKLAAVTSSATELNLLDGVSGLVQADFTKLAAVTASDAELNLLDGVSGLVQADFTKLAAVNSTADEINILDGDTSATSTTIADADRVIVNDAGTMKQVAVTDLAAYFDDEITAMPNLITTAATTVGALDAGSITSNFGAINIGASTITTTGLISGGSLDIDNVVINGATIGHTDDTDLITVASGVMTVAGEVDALSLDISGNADIDGTLEADAISIDGTTITATAAELNALDGINSTVTELNIVDGDTSATSTTVADADRVVFNDGGTMKQVAVTDLAAYFDDEITAMPNLVTTAATTVGALNSGSITSGFGAIDNGASNITTTGIAAVGRLQADNIRIDGNAITSTAGTDLTITPVAGQQIVLDGTIEIDAGVVTGATSITSTAFVGGLTGNVTGNASGTALSVTQAAQSAITSLGTLTTLTVDDIIINGGTIGHTSDPDAITIASGGDVTFSQDVVVSGNLTVTGTTTQVDTVTMNAANAVVFEGATADNNETTLTIIDPDADRTQRLINQSGYIPLLAAITTTAITATPEEINILDDAVITTAELNILDGGTSATSTTVVSADRLILNDGGTMKQISATDLQTFINAGSSNPNLTSVGALNAGSITSGFGSIDVGSDSVSTSGLLTYGVLNDGSTSLTATIVELNIMDGNTSASSTTIVDADRVVVNDNGTMKQVAVTDLAAYFDDEITAMGNLVETGALNAGSITSGFGAIDIGSSAFTTTGTGTVGTLVASSLFKMPDNTSTKFLVADGTSYQEVAMSGDATMANTGAITIANDAVENAMIADNAVDTAQIAADAVTGSEIADDAINSEHYTDGSIDTAHIADLQVTNAKIAADAVTGAKIADDALNSEHYTDASVDFAHIQNLAANTVVVRDANSSGVASAKAVTNTQILIGDGTGFTAAALSGDATMTNAGVVTIAATAIEGSMLNNNVISGQTALASGIADTDELMISDNGTLKRVDASVFKTYAAGAAASIDDATALAIALG